MILVLEVPLRVTLALLCISCFVLFFYLYSSILLRFHLFVVYRCNLKTMTFQRLLKTSIFPRSFWIAQNAMDQNDWNPIDFYYYIFLDVFFLISLTEIVTAKCFEFFFIIDKRNIMSSDKSFHFCG